MGSEEGNDSQEPGIIVVLSPPIFESNKTTNCWTLNIMDTWYKS